MQNSDLIKLYEEGHSIVRIAKLVGCGTHKIKQKLLNSGVPLRTFSESVHFALRAKPFFEDPKIQILLDGLLLGDGSVELGSVGSRFSITQAIQHLPWIEMIEEDFTNYGIEWKKTQKDPKTIIIKDIEYQRTSSISLRTRSYTYFTKQRKRWYPDSIKRVPQDVDLSPISVAHWYFGDGGRGGKGYHATFCTDGFTSEDVLFLMQRLVALYGWRPTRTDRNRILLSLAQDRKSLVEMIQPLTPTCFGYKLQLKTNMVLEHREQVLGFRKKGYSYGQIVETTGLSKAQISQICKKAGVAGRIK